MNTSALMLSRLQFAFTVSFHIIFPSFTIGLAAWRYAPATRCWVRAGSSRNARQVRATLHIVR
ncbi:cytochrome ubiquinol oxidase subunit I [Paraburkholderia sp.]|uniref:cytochrome ubiquinol oxidase subunit I n=2 Tax=Paraburkholderia sp. TaxID=1926495 RepID=UPI000A67D3BA